MAVRLPQGAWVPFEPPRLSLGLGVVAVAMAVVGVGTGLAYRALDRGPDWWRRFTDVNGEGNLPAWYSVLLLAASATVVLIIGHIRRTANDYVPAWLVLGGFLVVMSLDEMTSLHEIVGKLIDDRIHVPVVAGYGWIVPGAGLAAAAASVLWVVLVSLPVTARRAVVVAAGVYVSGALGLEVVEAVRTDETNRFGVDLHLLTGAQECLEMVGTVLYLRSMLTELVRVGSDTAAPAPT